MRGVIALAIAAAACGRIGFGVNGDANGDDGLTTDAGVPPIGLTGWWKLDDGSGASAIDSSGGGNTATLENSPSWVAGHIGGALDFHGTAYAKIMTPGLLGASAATISAWIFPRSFPPNTMVVYSDGYPGMYCGYDFIGRMTCTNDGGVTNPVSASFSLGAWHLVTGVRASDGTVTFYVDGVASGGLSQNAGPIGGAIYNSAIGARYDGVGQFDGLIDDVRVYARALSPAEVALLY